MRSRNLHILVLATLSVLAGALVVSYNPAPASATVVHPSVATETPRRDTPIVLDGIVYSSIQLQDRVIVAGDFTQVQVERNGPIVERNNLFAYDINSGELIEDFAPAVNNRIRSLVADPDGGAFYLGGTFTQIDGQFRTRVAKVGYDGTLDPVFRAVVSAEILTLDVHESVLYLGGSFIAVNNEEANRIGAIDATTGASVDGFDIQVTGVLGRAGSNSVPAIEVHPDGDRLLVAFNGQSLYDANGTHDRFGIGLIDLDTYTVNPWRTQWYEFAHPRCSQNALQLRDVSFSPDGSQFAVVEKGGFRCDKIVSFDTADDGTNDPAWVTAAHDSVFSVEVTNNAVYAGGHFCFVDPYGPVAATDAADFPWGNKPTECDIANGNVDTDGIAARQQIVALEPATGNVLDWNPTTTALEAIFDIESVDRGLLLGQDGPRVNNIITGRQAFLDFGGVTPGFEPPAPPVLECTATVDGDTVTLNWSDSDAIRHTVLRDGRWAATLTDTTFSQAPGFGEFAYEIRFVRAAGNIQIPCDPNPVTLEAPAPPPPPVLECTATVDGDTVTLNWSDSDAIRHSVLRDGRWAATLTDTTFTTTGAGSFEIRFVRAAGNIEVPCDLGADPQPEPEPFNRALGQTVSQSSTGFSGVATRAVDGNTSGVYRQGSVTHTNNEAQPWWQVDLGESGSISTVEIWNRTDCCTARLSDVVVFVSDTDMTGRSIAELQADPTVTTISIDGPLAANTELGAQTTGQFVRVQLRGTNPLSLAEVIVNS